jgi:tyrosyl-tRNA synthetase
MQAGRTLQKNLRQKDTFVMTNVILEGTDGRKMSKSWGNAIWLDDNASDMYAKVMAINDELIVQYFTLATKFSLEDIKQLEQRLNNKEEHPMKAKKKLAQTIVENLHSKYDAEKAAEAFEKLVQKDELPLDIQKVHIKDAASIVDVLVETKLAESKSEARRLIEQGGVEVNGEKVLNSTDELTEKESLIQVGKRKFVKVIR